MATGGDHERQPIHRKIKVEAVRQCTALGHPVKDVAKRLGISSKTGTPKDWTKDWKVGVQIPVIRWDYAAFGRTSRAMRLPDDASATRKSCVACRFSQNSGEVPR